MKWHYNINRGMLNKIAFWEAFRLYFLVITFLSVVKRLMLSLEQSLFIIPTKKAAKSEQPHVKWSDESERKRPI